MKLLIKKLSKDAKLPTKAYKGDAGLDLYSNEDTEIQPKSIKKISTGIAIAIPEGFFGKIFDRSSVATKNGLFVVAGVIDSGYRGEIIVCLYNSTDKLIKIQKHQKIAQLVLLPTYDFEITEVKTLPSTERNKRGFGSSDKIS